MERQLEYMVFFKLLWSVTSKSLSKEQKTPSDYQWDLSLFFRKNKTCIICEIYGRTTFWLVKLLSI